MKKAELEFIAFNTEDVITTSGVSPVPDLCSDVSHYKFTDHAVLADSGEHSYNCYEYLNGQSKGVISVPKFPEEIDDSLWYTNQNAQNPCPGTTHNSW